MARWSAAVVWDNFRAMYDDVDPPEVSREVDLFTPGFAPRTVEVQLRIPGARELRRAGQPIESCMVSIYRDGVPWCTSPVVQIRTRGTSPVVTVVMAERAARDNPVPPTSDIQVRALDVERTKWVADISEQIRRTAVDAWVRYDKQHPFRPDPVPWNLCGGWVDPGKVYATSVQGKVLPVVIGSPGRNGEPAWRGLPVDDLQYRLLIAGHHMQPGTATVHKDTGGDDMHPTEYTLINTQIAGRNVAVVELPAFGSAPNTDYDASATYYVSCNGSASGLSGTSADVVRLLFGLTRGVRYDRGAWAAVDDVLRAYTLDTAMDQVADAWELLLNDVLSLLPVRLIDTPFGLGAVVVPRSVRTAPDKKVIRIGVTADVLDEDGVLGRADRISEVTVAYAGSAASSGFTRTVIADATNSEAAREAFGAIGTAARRVETPWIGEAATAQRVAQDLAALGAMDGISMSLMLFPQHHGEDGLVPLELCDVVTVVEIRHGQESSMDGVVTGLSQLGNDIRATILVVH